MKVPRRAFLGGAVAGTAGVLIPGGQVPAAVRATASNIEPTALVPLGKQSKLTVSRIGFGTGMKGWKRESNQTRMGYDKFRDLLRYAYDQGIRLFDAADLYGTHEMIGKALADKPRDSYAVVTKIWWRKDGLVEDGRPDADVCVKRFLKELGSDYFDLVHLHCVTSNKWPDELRRQMDILSRLKEQGLLRAHGVSCHSLGALEAAAAEPWVDAVNARINPYGTKMDGEPGKVVAALEKIHAAGKGVIGMKVIGEGQFGDDPVRREASVRFVTGLDCVDAMVVGFEQRSHIDEFKQRVAAALAAKHS